MMKDDIKEIERHVDSIISKSKSKHMRRSKKILGLSIPVFAIVVSGMVVSGALIGVLLTQYNVNLQGIVAINGAQQEAVLFYDGTPLVTQTTTITAMDYDVLNAGDEYTVTHEVSNVGMDYWIVIFNLSNMPLNYVDPQDVWYGFIFEVREHGTTTPLTEINVGAGETVEFDYYYNVNALFADPLIAFPFDLRMTITKAVLSEPTEIFSYGFENWTAAFPPNGWGIYNLNTGNTWVQSTTGQRSGVACAKCTYDYEIQPNDDWLTTKGTVVAPGGIFSVWVDTYSYGDDEYEIYMSTTGNTPDDFLNGTLLAGVYYPVPTTYTQYTFDMSVYVGQTVYFGVRYIGWYAWYIWVDDATFPDGTTEGFENTVSSWSGWSQIVISGTSPNNKWDGAQTGIYPTGSPHGDSWMARYNAYGTSAGNSARLQRDASFDFSSHPELNIFTLKFWMFHDTGYAGTNDRVSVIASTDKSTWYTMGTFSRYDGTSGWAQHSVDLSAFKDYNTVYIGFLGTSDYGNNMYIDDVEITGSNLSG